MKEKITTIRPVSDETALLLGHTEERPCKKHKIAFTKECPESKNIEDLYRCEVCGFLVKD